VADTGNAPLYGIENTNRECTLASNFLPGQQVQPSLALAGGPGLGIITGKADLSDSDPNASNPGGVPIFRSGVVAGEIGVTGVWLDVAEYAAYTAAPRTDSVRLPRLRVWSSLTGLRCRS